MREYGVGEKISCKGSKLKVSEYKVKLADCEGCYFLNKNKLCKNALCSKSLRKDKKNIFFEEIEEEINKIEIKIEILERILFKATIVFLVSFIACSLFFTA